MIHRDYTRPLRIPDLRPILERDARFRQARWTIHYWGPNGIAVGTELFVPPPKDRQCSVT